jgi:hypothetical protein
MVSWNVQPRYAHRESSTSCRPLAGGSEVKIYARTALEAEAVANQEQFQGVHTLDQTLLQRIW